MTPLIYHIGMGSNLGDRMAHCRAALSALGALSDTRIHAVSALYETQPVCAEGPWFFNGAVELATTATPLELLKHCQQIEASLGRSRPKGRSGDGRAAPRTIDLDLLLCGDLIIDTEELKIPHPRLHERRFALIPLLEIAPHAKHPILGKPLRQILEALSPTHQIRRMGTMDETVPMP